ncbi:MAG: hypothetical protein ACRDMX_17725 [Solirubrobacteraceae bacterium]
MVEHGGVPWTVVRATQFHDLVATMLAAAAHWRISPAARARVQPVDVEETVARCARGLDLR